MTDAVTAVSGASSRPIGVKLAAALAGVLLVAAAAQVAIPIPGSPVPFTLQPLAVLIVGGLLGARYGALSLALYLALGAAGLPVFTPLGAPGLARLVGPTGGFLIAYPFAAAVVGMIARRSYLMCLLAALLGMVVIFAGGFAQLAILSPASVGAVITPFIAADLVKSALAAAAIRRFHATTRALR